MLYRRQEAMHAVHGLLALWRGQDSNLRPLGYEPNELPLLHPAVSFCECKFSDFCHSCQISQANFVLKNINQESISENQRIASCRHEAVSCPNFKVALNN